MARAKSDYIAMALVRRASAYSPGRTFRGDATELQTFADEACGFAVPPSLLSAALQTLHKCGIASISDDDFAGTFFKVDPQKFRSFVDSARQETSELVQRLDDPDTLPDEVRFEAYPHAMLLARHQVFEDYYEFDENWLNRALFALRSRIESDETVAAPDELVRDEPAKSEAWTGRSRTTFELSETKRTELELRLHELDREIELADLTNEERSQAKALVTAAILLTTAPQPPTDVIFDILKKLNDISGIAALVVSIIALLVS